MYRMKTLWKIYRTKPTARINKDGSQIMRQMKGYINKNMRQIKGEMKNLNESRKEEFE